MKKEEIEKSVLLGLQPRLDEIADKIRIHWESKLDDYKRVNLEVPYHKDYLDMMAHSEKVFKEYLEHYWKLALRIYNCSEHEQECAKYQITKIQEEYVRSIERNHQMIAKKLYYETCGYDSSKSYADKGNRAVMKSYSASMLPYFQKGIASVERRMKKDMKDAIEYAKGKLMNQVHKVLLPIVDDIKVIEHRYDDNSPTGLVAVFHVTTMNGEKYIFKTQCIEAGGYNIQCWHYRYICNLKKPKI